MYKINRRLAQRIATTLTEKHRKTIEQAEEKLKQHIQDEHMKTVPAEIKKMFLLHPSYLRMTSTAVRKVKSGDLYVRGLRPVPSRNSGYIQIKRCKEFTAWKKAVDDCDKLWKSLADFLTGKSVQTAAKAIPEITANADIKTLLDVQAKAEQKKKKAVGTAAQIRKELNLKSIIGTSLKTILVILMLSITITGSAQTSKDSLTLKMSRTEWKAASDTLQFLILPAIGRSRSADEADLLQNWFTSVIGRMYYRLDTSN